jgi:DNA-binding CsgD family transcriptional regulator
MYTERTNLRIDPHDTFGEDSLLLGKLCVNVYQSRQSADEVLNRTSDYTRPVTFEVQFNSVTSETTQPTTTDESESAFTSDDVTEDSISEGITTTLPVTQIQAGKILQILGAEHRRISQQFNANSKVFNFCRRLKELSPRESDVLLLIIQGKSCKELAAHLKVGIATAAKHRANAFRKLDVRNSTELVYLLIAVFSQSPTPIGRHTGRAICPTNHLVENAS